jgi:type I restriction enzyme S subunit
MNKILEAIGQSIFKHWFVDFEFPNEQSKPYKNSGGEMVESELGKIPKGWKVGKLKGFSKEITRGFTTSYVDKSNLINLNQKVNRGEYLDKSNYKYYPENAEVPQEKFAKMKDILINSLGQGTLGRIHLFWENVQNVVVDQHITIVRTSDKICSEYLYFYLIFPANQIRMEAQITGSTGMLMLNVSKIRDFEILIPDSKINKRFSEIISNLYDLKRKSTLENEILSQIRDSLLPKLMSGKIRIPAEA